MEVMEIVRENEGAMLEQVAELAHLHQESVFQTFLEANSWLTLHLFYIFHLEFWQF